VLAIAVACGEGFTAMVMDEHEPSAAGKCGRAEMPSTYCGCQLRVKVRMVKTQVLSSKNVTISHMHISFAAIQYL